MHTLIDMTRDDDCASLGFEGSIPDPFTTTSPLSIKEISNSSTTPIGGMLGGTIPSTDAPQVTETPEEKKQRRVMANRRSAKESRARRKHLLSKLQVTVDVLSAENRSMRKANSQLRGEMQELKRQLMIANSLVSGRSGAAAGSTLQHSTTAMNNSSTTQGGGGGGYHHDLTYMGNDVSLGYNSPLRGGGRERPSCGTSMLDSQMLTHQPMIQDRPLRQQQHQTMLPI